MVPLMPLRAARKHGRSHRHTVSVARCEKLLAGVRETIQREELAEFDQDFLEKLIEARLLCTASHETPPTP
jgi:hypothetical protein